MARSNRPAKYSTRALAIMAKYELPEETPQLICSTVIEIERDLRARFPGVFDEAVLRRQAKWERESLF